jgi:hypothetical protein
MRLPLHHKDRLFTALARCMLSVASLVRVPIDEFFMRSPQLSNVCLTVGRNPSTLLFSLVSRGARAAQHMSQTVSPAESVRRRT